MKTGSHALELTAPARAASQAQTATPNESTSLLNETAQKKPNYRRRFTLCTALSLVSFVIPAIIYGLRADQLDESPSLFQDSQYCGSQGYPLGGAEGRPHLDDLCPGADQDNTNSINSTLISAALCLSELKAACDSYASWDSIRDLSELLCVFASFILFMDLCTRACRSLRQPDAQQGFQP